MKARIMAAVAAATLALSMGVASAAEIGSAAPGYQYGEALAQVHYMP